MNRPTMMMTIVIPTVLILSLFVSPPAYGQNQSGVQQQQTEDKPLPVLLIHGYAVDAAVWKMGGHAQKRWD